MMIPPKQRDVTDIGKVTAISSIEATVKTIGGILHIPWTNGLPDPIPAVGETWFIQSFAPLKWRFLNKVPNNNGYNVLKYGIYVDLASHTDDERTVVEDIHQMGFDQIFLKIAGDGVVYWDSDSAESCGLLSKGDKLQGFISRAKDYGLAVVFVIDCELFPEKAYNQWSYINGEVVYQRPFSFAATMRVMKFLVDELYEKYREDVRGIVFYNCSYKERGDINPRQVSFYSEDQNVTYSENDIDNRLWYESLGNAQKAWLKYITEDIGNWSISCVAGKDIFHGEDYFDVDCGRYGWSMVGSLISVLKAKDATSQARSLEISTAYSKRIAKDSESIAFLSVDDISSQSDALSLLNRYDIQLVVFDDYDRMVILDNEKTNSILERMNKSRVVERTRTVDVGIMIKPQFDRRYATLLNDICSSILEYAPYRVRILSQGEYIPNLSALVVFSIEQWSDKELDYLMQYMQTYPTIIVGLTGTKTEMDNTRRQNPFDRFFDIISDGTDLYINHISSESFGISEIIWSIPDQTSAMRFITKTDSHTISQNDKNKEIDVPGFIAIKDHSLILGSDILTNDMIGEQVGRAVAYSLRRG